MSNNKSAPGTPGPITMDTIYIDFFAFLQNMIDPILPESIKEKEMYKTANDDFSKFIKTVKGFAYVNAAIGEMCKSENTKKSIKNITSVTEDETKLKESVTEIKTLAGKIAEYCTTLANTPDEEISDKIETFSLYVETITKQFTRTTTKC